MSQGSNPLLEQLRRRIPGETFRLPSKGMFYTDDELALDVVDGEVHVFPMSTLDEITLNSPDKLLNGTAVEDVFKNCIPQIKKPLKMLQSDVEFLLTCLQAVSFGKTTNTTYKHTCKDASAHEYVIDLDKLVRTTAYVDPTMSFKHKLVSGHEFAFKPPRYDDMIKFYQQLALMKTSDDEDIQVQKSLFVLFSNMIDSVRYIPDDTVVTDKTFILEWISALPSSMLDVITEQIATNTRWGIERKHVDVCKDCGQQIELDANINPVHFFI